MDLDKIISEVIAAFKSDPRNEVYVDESVLLASAIEETGDSELGAVKLREAIAAYLEGNMEEGQESIYDGAVYSCGRIARGCFSEEPDEDIDYEINWVENEDSSYTACVSPM